MWEHDVPEEAFIVHELREGALTQTKGVVKYRPEFQAVSPQREETLTWWHHLGADGFQLRLSPRVPQEKDR